MLFSTHLFASFSCPLNRVGQCHRPYCQFNHDAPIEQINAELAGTKINQDNETLKNKPPQSADPLIGSQTVVHNSGGEPLKRTGCVDEEADSKLGECPSKLPKQECTEKPPINGSLGPTRIIRSGSPKRIAHSGAGRLTVPTNPASRNVSVHQQLLDRYLTSPADLSVAAAGKRIAHTPNPSAMSFAPLVITSGQCRLPSESRRPFIKKLYDEFRKIGKEDSLQQAKQEELTIACQASSLNAYRNNMAKAVFRIRHCRKDGVNDLSEADAQQASNGSKHCPQISLPSRRIQVEHLSEPDLYDILVKYTLDEESLGKHGYPRPGTKPTEVVIKRNPYWSGKVREPDDRDPQTRICDRCLKEFKVDSNEFPVPGEQCIYHWGRLRLVKSSKRYVCCGAESNSLGCTSAKVHVVRGGDSSKSMLEGFVYTIPHAQHLNRNTAGIFALDCEMCYTTKGLEVTRITVVNHQLRVVYESYVLPDNPIIDYNTRWSGVTEAHLAGVRTRLSDVRSMLNEIISDKSILIGHGLENDLIGLKLIHNVIIDTSVMFPHRLGYPYKRSLKDLLCEKLNKIIQDDAGGHSSLEDAIACMELVLWQARQDLRSSSSNLLQQICG